MLTKGDDFPIHQTPEPIAYTGAVRNFYDRYFFNGYHLPARPELLEAARKVEVPTALVWGTQDPFCPISVADTPSGTVIADAVASCMAFFSFVSVVVD